MLWANSRSSCSVHCAVLGPGSDFPYTVPASAVFDDNRIPAMPCTTSVQHNHRVKNGAHGNCFNAMVTRPITRKEMLNNPKAMEAFTKEWKGLWEQEVFDFSQTREYDDVVNEAKKKGQRVHMARVHGLIYEKNYQLKEDDPARKFKGRGVLLGDQVKDQNMEAALFQDLGNSPATFDASRWADYYGCLPGNDVHMADAIQAYIQAKLSGTPCWVELPDEAWHPSANRHKYRRPVCRLVKALYGRWEPCGSNIVTPQCKSRFQTAQGRMAIVVFPS